MNKQINKNKKIFQTYELIPNKNHENSFFIKENKIKKRDTNTKLFATLIFKLATFSLLLSILLIMITKLFNENSFTIPKKINIKNSSTEKQLTIVSALYDIGEKKRDFNLYYKWSENLFTLNTPIVFFVDPKIANKVKSLRPKEYDNITIFIEINVTDFYSYKNYYNDIVDFKKRNPSCYMARFKPELYLIWSEKINFVKIAIKKNYFNSKYFAWVDAGYFRNKKKSEMPKYKNWPHLTKEYEGPRIKITNVIRGYKNKIYNLLINYNASLLIEEKFRVAGGFFWKI